MTDSLLQFFGKIALDPSLLPYPHIFLFFSPFCVIKNLMDVPTKALENFFSFKGQKSNDQRF